MQEKNIKKCTFLHRTDILAAANGLNVQELTNLLGLSRRTLFLCRADDAHVTKKTLLRLEAAEKAAGICPSSVNLTEEESDNLLQPVVAINERIARLEAQFERLTGLLEKLLEQRATSSTGHGTAVETARKKIS